MMTDAPDPGLTDLIATHAIVDMTMEGHGVQCKCQPFPADGNWMRADEWPAHVALVVEPHATVGSKQWRAMFRTNLERAEKAEATIARVRGEVSAYSEIIPTVALTNIRAALEGEQQ